MQSTLEDLKNRRSIRAYKPEQIKDEELDAILEAGTWAASGAGAQSAVIVVVQDKALISELEGLNARVLNNPQAKPFYGAPTVLAVLVDQTKPTPLEDGSLVIGNLMLAASAIGVGSCWIHRAKQVFEFEEGKGLLKKWGLSEHYVGVGFCILGYAAGDPPKPADRKAGYIIKAR
ncbi:MAG: nitroreductase family protein [Treponema sp.]|jgi:nitroreductase|nr:nitroreductase family protein [Treponema sp.]